MILAFSILVGFFVSNIIISKKYSKSDVIFFNDNMPYTVFVSIIGARLFYCIGDYKYYLKYPLEIIMINHGGLSIFGGIIFGIFFLYLLSKKNNISIYKFGDILALVMPLCQAIGRWGNFINQEAYGLPYNGFIKLFVDSKHRIEKFIDVEYYHPTFLYESMLDLLIFFVLVLLFLKTNKLRTGTIFYLYLIFYSIARIIVENLRIDSVCLIFGIHVATIISILVIFVSMILLKRINKKI